MNKKNWKKKLLCLPLCFLLAGCHILDDIGVRDETVYPPAFPVDHPAPPKTNGTIYQAGREISLYQDHVAHHVGDILTVKLQVETQGQKQSEMKTNKVANINTNTGDTSNNPSTQAGGLLRPVLFGGPIQGLIFNTGSDMEFNGKGQTNAFNKLYGTISVTVISVLSNNNLVIQGESWVTINQGREYIRLSGIVRPEDIETDNTISSQRIADARIAYSGNGQVGNTSRGGIMTQLFTKFFPY